MPFDVGESINGLADSFLRAPIVPAVARNPIYTSLLLVFVVMITTLIIFRDVDSDESLLVLTLRSGFWVFLFTMGIFVIHNKVLSTEFSYHEKNAAYEGVFDSKISSAEENIVPVVINTDFPADF